MKSRCNWCGDQDIYIKYHDREWGVPVKNDKKLFEFLILEGAQAGLSWLTILKKRKGYRMAFDNFDFNKIAKYNEKKIQALLKNPDIIRNQLKIRSTVSNARAFIRVRKEYGTFSRYIWKFVDGKPVINSFLSGNQIPAHTEISDKMAEDLKKRGFKFVGTTICYSFMQATGMVNDHVTGCFRYNQV